MKKTWDSAIPNGLGPGGQYGNRWKRARKKLKAALPGDPIALLRRGKIKIFPGDIRSWAPWPKGKETTEKARRVRWLPKWIKPPKIRQVA
jgi:hypothetical protein